MAAFDPTAFEDAFLGNASRPPTLITPTPRIVLRTSLRAKIWLAIVALVMVGGTVFTIANGGHLSLPAPAPSACELHWQNDYVMKGTVGGLTREQYLARCNHTSDIQYLEKNNPGR